MKLAALVFLASALTSVPSAFACAPEAQIKATIASVQPTTAPGICEIKFSNLVEFTPNMTCQLDVETVMDAQLALPIYGSCDIQVGSTQPRIVTQDNAILVVK